MPGHIYNELILTRLEFGSRSMSPRLRPRAIIHVCRAVNKSTQGQADCPTPVLCRHTIQTRSPRQFRLVYFAACLLLFGSLTRVWNAPNATHVVVSSYLMQLYAHLFVNSRPSYFVSLGFQLNPLKMFEMREKIIKGFFESLRAVKFPGHNDNHPFFESSCQFWMELSNFLIERHFYSVIKLAAF